MAEQAIQIEIKGLDEVLAKINQFPEKIAGTIGQAGSEAAERVVLPTQGLKTYPPAGAGNQPPTPYYVRGRGMQFENGNDYRSEVLGTKWVVKSEQLKTTIGNTASYAHWVHDDEQQAKAMGRLGWKKLFATAKEKISEITQVYQAWIDKLIADIGLR